MSFFQLGSVDPYQRLFFSSERGPLPTPFFQRRGVDPYPRLFFSGEAWTPTHAFFQRRGVGPYPRLFFSAVRRGPLPMRFFSGGSYICFYMLLYASICFYTLM